MGLISGLIIGFCVGVVFAPIALRLFKVLWSKISKNVDNLEK